MRLVPNVIALMTPEQFNTLVPETLKELAWKRTVEPDGSIVYTQRTWKQMTLDPQYIEWYGVAEFFADATLNGVSIGPTNVVRSKLSLSDKNVLDIAWLGMRLISEQELIEFLRVNSL
jgi:hypothetical protein